MSVEETPLTAAEIYEKINSGPGLGYLQQSQYTLARLLALMDSSAADVRALNSRISAGFHGRSGDAAANATRPLSKATDDDLDHLAMVDGSISAQMTAFSTVKNSVQPVSAQPPPLTARELLEVLVGRNSGYEQKIGEWAADSRANIQAFSAYYDASTTNAQHAPSQFGYLVDPGEQVTLARREAAGPARSDSSSPKSGTSGIRSPAPPGHGVQPLPNQPVREPAVPVPAPTWNDGTTAATDTPTGGDLAEGYRFGTTGSLGPRANPSITADPSTGYYLGGAPGEPGGSRDGYAGFGSREPGGAPGRGAGTTAGPARGVGGRGRGRRSGAVAETEAATRGGRPATAGNAGKPGQGGLPGIGHGGKKDEDKERKRPGYLRNPDPDGTFADPVSKTTPPVIGER